MSRVCLLTALALIAVFALLTLGARRKELVTSPQPSAPPSSVPLPGSEHRAGSPVSVLPGEGQPHGSALPGYPIPGNRQASDWHDAAQALLRAQDPALVSRLAKELLVSGSNEAVAIWAHELLNDDQSPERREALAAAVRFLAGPGSDEQIASLIELEYSPAVLSLVRDELAYRATSDTVAYLLEIRANQSLSSRQRNAALLVIEGIYSKTAADGLLQALGQTEDPGLIRAAAAALARQGNAIAVKKIAEISSALETEHPKLAFDLRQMLSGAAYPELEPLLEEIQLSPSYSPSIREAAASARAEAAQFKAARLAPSPASR